MSFRISIILLISLAWFLPYDSLAEESLQELDEKCMQMYREDQHFRVGWYCTQGLKRGGAMSQYVMAKSKQRKRLDHKGNKEALALFEKSAALGFAPAYTALGRLYFGRCSDKDEMIEARPFLEICAANDVNARMLIGMTYIMQEELIEGRAWVTEFEQHLPLPDDLKEIMTVLDTYLSTEDIEISDNRVHELAAQFENKPVDCEVVEGEQIFSRN